MNTKPPGNVLLSSAEIAAVSDAILCAGPFHLIFREGAFRYIKFEGREIVRAVYVAVRDEKWRTVPGAFSNLDIRTTSDSFKIFFDCVHRQQEIDFRWKADLSGDADGCITWKMEGQAFTSFKKNRIGICVLHPLDGFIGEPCEITHTDGSMQHSRFPVSVAPHQPFLDMAAMRFRVNSDLDAELEFAGDVFETEDQRNWTDASFKTYSTPLSLPYPAMIDKGALVSQSFTLKLLGKVHRSASYPPDDEQVAVTLHPEVRTKLPRLGFKFADSKRRLSEASAIRLKALLPDHLGVDLYPGRFSSEEAFWTVAEEARRLSLPIEVALAAEADPEAQKRILVEVVKRKVAICSWLADVRLQLPAHIEELRDLEEIAPVVLGAGPNFAELNRNRPSERPEGGVWFSLNPQVHASDDATIVENLAAQSSVLDSIRDWFGPIPITVSPVRLKQRVDSIFDDHSQLGGNGMPEDVDLRQSSLLGAGWTLGSLKHLAEGAVNSATFYETAGWRGVMEAPAGWRPPSTFPSDTDAVFPMYHVFADVAAFKGAQVIHTDSTHPLRVEGLALIGSSGLRVIVANLTARECNVRVRLGGIARRAELRQMHEGNVGFSMIHPELHRHSQSQKLHVQDGELRLDMKPFAIATIDAERVPVHSETEIPFPGES